MKQRFIVEGNDGWALTQLCESNGLPLPTGYTKKTIRDFVKSSGGYANMPALVEATLLEAEIENIGIVIDANDAGPAARWASLKSLLAATFSQATLDAATPAPEGIVLKEAGKPTVGIWIMPNNANNGYLEHFLADLADKTDDLWKHNETVVKDLSARKFCRYQPVREQKALLHTWLAWQEEPGKPFGTALASGYLNAKNPAARPFLTWMQNTFRLGP